VIAPTAAGKPLDALRFDNSFARLPAAFYERVKPTPIPHPKLAAFSSGAARLIDLRPGEEVRESFLRFASGEAFPHTCAPVAAIYAGHQFGSFVPQLGDGRAILLGEVINDAGEHWEIQLKGSGRTPFSRFGDGRAVLRSTIREFLCSEAMHHLGIPTTRALAIAGSDEPVARETMETAATLVRLAPTFVRFGSFELFHYRAKHDEIRRLADYLISRFLPHLIADEDRYERFFTHVVTETAALFAAWQAVGFAHGVLNTDNMSILGLTLDYGPYGFLDAYEPGFICNHTDQGGRYAFDRQPTIGLWNCYALANALTSLLGKVELETALAAYEPAFRDRYRQTMIAKLGLMSERDEDRELIVEVLRLLAAGRVDYTRFFRSLAAIGNTGSAAGEALVAESNEREAWEAWLARYRARVAADGRSDADRHAAMNAVNPKFILRNYLAQQAIAAAERGDYSELVTLQTVLEHPFDEQPDHERFAEAPPAWAGDIEVSCSS